MSTGSRSSTVEKPPEASGKETTGTRKLTRRVKASQRRAAQAARGKAVAAGGRATRSLLAPARRALAGVPAAAWVCALLAFVNAACWSLIAPPFQAPDEPDHFAYVQQLAEAGRLPSLSQQGYSAEENIALLYLRQAEVRFRPTGRPISSRAEQDRLTRQLARPLPRRGSGNAGLATSEPPLYYALETIPYRLASKGTILDRLELMRLMSALMGGLTALFAFLFLREALPAARWAWAVGGIGVALAPQLGFISGVVNPDAMLFAVSAAIFYCLARAFRRGLTRRSAIAIGTVMAVGFLTKLNFIGLAPGVMLGLVVLVRREARRAGLRSYYELLAPALLIAASPGLLYALVNALSNHPALGALSGNTAAIAGTHTSISAELSYIWQFYLPRLPGMHSDFSWVSTTRQVWFRNVIGLYGWADTVFPGWVYELALILVGLIAALCIRELAAHRIALRRRVTELTTYAAIALGVLLLVGAAGYSQSSTLPIEYAEPRYLLPMIALWGAVLALAARGAGRRWGPPIGALLVVLVIAHDLFSQLQVIARYHG
jgi:hypothetical protein